MKNFLFLLALCAGVTAQAATEKAILAGGCFWCMESPFESIPGVISVVSGYTGGHTKNPTYEEVSAGSSGHAEAVEITFDPAKTSYERILEVFWRQIDPTNARGQFVDVGPQYRSAIFYLSDKQKRAAEASRAAQQKSKRFEAPIVTEITKAGPFYRAEEYHQDFYKKNPEKYERYRAGSGRDQFLNGVWGKQKK